MKDSDWKILHELYLNPNLTRVANQMYITQPSLTKRLQHMEQEFGITIVNRTSKGLDFTPEGKLLAQRARIYLDFMDDLQNDLKAMKEKRGQEIIVASAYSYVKTELPDLMLRYSRHHPDVRFTVVTDQSNVLFRKVIDGEVDVGIIRGDYEGPVEQCCLGSDPGYLVTWKSMELDSIPTMQRIAYNMNDRTHELFDNWWKQQFGTDAPAGMNVGYVDVALELIYKGLGYALCFLPASFENPNDLYLTPLLNPDGTPVERRTWLVWSPKSRNLSPSVLDFIDHVKKEIHPKN